MVRCGQAIWDRRRALTFQASERGSLFIHATTTAAWPMSAQRIFGCRLAPARSGPHMVAVEEELAAQNQQPDPESEAQRPARDACAQKSPANRPSHAADNELQQQLWVGGVREPVRAAADERNHKAKDDIGSHHFPPRQPS